MQFISKIYHFHWHSFVASLYSLSTGVVIFSTQESVRQLKGAHLNQKGRGNDKRKHYASLDDITDTAAL